MTVAVVFPGQGAAVPGAGAAWVDHPAWRVVTEAEEVLDRPLGWLLLDATEAELASTWASQLAVLLTSLVVWDAVEPLLSGPPVAFAGHSLGQITALIASGTVDRADGLRLALARAEVCQASADRSPGGMLALLGGDLATAHDACDGVDGAWVANDNAPGQVVVAGALEALPRVAQRARELGVRRVTRLSVGHAFHTPLLADAAAALRPTLDATTWRSPSSPLVTNHDAAVCRDAAGWTERLQRHLVEPVRWRESVGACRELSTQVFIELGPAAVLSGLIRRTVTGVTSRSVATPDEASALHALLEDGEMATDAFELAALETLS